MRFAFDGWSKSVALTACLLSGCLADPDPQPAPLSVAGTYISTVASGANGCQFGNASPGVVTTNIEVSIEQVNERVRGTVKGAIGFLLNLWAGSNLFEGTIEGTKLVMELHGSVPQMLDECSYTIDATMTLDASEEGQLDGDIVYTIFTAGDPECEALEGCETLQSVTALRESAQRQ